VKQETHHAMKKLFYSILFLFAFIGAVNAQVLPNDFYIYGQVTRSSDNSAVANKLVEVWRDTVNGSGSAYYATTYTNASGNYNFYITNGSVVGPNQIYKVRVYDCQNFGNVQTTQNNQGTTDMAQLNFSICDNNNLCQAGYTPTINPGSLAVYFNNTSSVTTGQINSWCWDFGDGQTSCNAPNISANHVYANAGTYYVCLTIGTTAGCTSTYCDSITVGCNNVTGFSVNPQNNTTFTFVPTTSGTAPFTYTWNFGDGPNETSTGVITHAYNAPGTYTVCCYSQDANGCVSSYCTQVTVAGNSCAAGFTLQTNQNNQILVVGTMDGQINNLATYSWTWGDGTSDNGGPTSQHFYANSGTYTVCVTVSYNGCSDSYCQQVTVGCDATFTITPGNNLYTYYLDPVTPGGIWQIQPTTFLQPNPNGVITFPNAGTYYICYTAPGTNGTSCTYCDSLVVTPVNGPCDGSFSYGTNLLGNYTFNPVSGGNGYSHLWTFGDGTSSSMEYPNHTYTSNGTYTVCHTIFDNNGCQDTECQTISVTLNNTGCQAYFYGNPLNPNNLNDLAWQFTDYSASGDTLNPIIGWTWSFGDGSNSSLQNPIHDYATSGSYVVCLTVWNNNGCQSQYCDSIYVGGSNTQNIISGTVYTSVNVPASVAYVFLLRFDYPNSQLVPEGADVTSNGGYIFNNVPNGDYVVKAALTPNDPLYAVRIPTYHTAAMLWNFGDVITINNNSYTTGDIYMIAAANQGGPGFIGGTVDWADTLRAATDFSGATVILQTIAGDNIAFATADANGAYSFSNLAYGTYKLYADFPGYTGDPTFVTITPITDSIADAQVLLGPANLTGVEETSVIDGISLYPNPTTDNATLVVEASKTSQLSLTVVNMVGQVVGSQTINAYAGKNTVQVNTDNLAQGVYTLVLRDSKGVAKAQRLVKQ
jgi:PKD repeat protein